MLQNNLIPPLITLPRLRGRRPGPILPIDIYLVRILALHALAALLPVHRLAAPDRDVAPVDNAANGVDALLLVEAERVVGQRDQHRVFFGRVG